MNDWRAAVVFAGAAALVWHAAPARAADDAARAQLEQKIRLVASLLSDSPTAQRIAGSGNEQAMAHLNEGRVHHAAAKSQLEVGDLTAARRSADEALVHLGMARRMVPDAPSRQAAARQRHEQLVSSVERLFEAWRSRAAASATSDGSEMMAAAGLLDVARQQAQQGRYDDANQALARAQQHVLTGMRQSLGGNTLDYTQRPANVAEEYQLELARLRSHVELLPLAVRDLRPTTEAQALIERYTEAANVLQTQAQQQFQAGDAGQALAQVRSAALYVQRALLAAGLATPQASGSPP
jgi:hypothetical protein